MVKEKQNKKSSLKRQWFLISLIGILAVTAGLLERTSAFAMPLEWKSGDLARQVDDPTVYVDRMTGFSSRTFTAAAVSAKTFINPGCTDTRWVGSPCISSPTFKLMVNKSEDGVEWTTTMFADFNTNDPFPVFVDARYDKYISEPENSSVQSDDLEIVALAQELTAGCVWQSEAVEKINIWVRGNIQYMCSDSDALSVLHYRKGQCVGFSNLTTALLRAVGIPANTVDGCVLSGLGWPSGGHAWNVVFYPSAGWVYSDPQNTIFMLDVQHVVNPPTYIAYYSTPELPAGVGEGPMNYNEEVVSSDNYTSMNYNGVLSAASVTHNEPMVVSPPVVAIEMAPGMSNIMVENSYWEFHGHVSGSPTAAWYRWIFDSTTINEGGPENTLFTGNLPPLSGLNSGVHTLTFDVEDIWGNHSSADIELINPKDSKENSCAIFSSLTGRPGCAKTVQTYRNLRDAKLSTSIRGKILTALYYMNSQEISVIFAAHPQIRKATADILEEFVPKIEQLADGKHTVFTQKEMKKIKNALNKIAQYGSFILKMSIKLLIIQTNNEDFLKKFGVEILSNK